MLGSLACFAIADAIGRRYTLLIAATQFFLGSMVEFLSGVPSWPSGVGLSVLIIGRLIYGIGCGFAMHGVGALLLD
jgi:MFS family permease